MSVENPNKTTQKRTFLESVSKLRLQDTLSIHKHQLYFYVLKIENKNTIPFTVAFKNMRQI